MLDPPPQPVAAAPQTSSTRQTANQKPLVFHCFLLRRSGSRSSGRKTMAPAESGMVSVKTTTTWYVPFGVVDAVVIMTAELDAE